MRIGWFKWLYNRVMPWKEALFASIRASWAWRYGRIVKARIKKRLEPFATAAKAVVLKLRARFFAR